MKQGVLRWAGGLAIVLASALFVAFRIPHSVSTLGARNERIRTLQDKNAALRKETRDKADRIRRLKESQSEMELEIRKNLKLQRPNDTTIVVKP